MEKEAQQIQKEYEDGLNYKRRMGFLDKWPEYERFKAGDQWPAATERTKHLPRPVFNIIELVETHKVASVMSENIKMVFTPLEQEDPASGEAAEMFSKFSETTWERIKQDSLNEEMLEDGSNRGTGILHYYWDANAKGGKVTAWRGEMCGEVLDPINVFPGNPQQRNLQKQPYIIVSCRELLESVKKEAKLNKLSKAMIEQIKPDKETKDQGYDSAQVELADANKTTVLIKYERGEDGYIYFTKACSGLIIKPRTNSMLRLYPLAAMPWKRRKKAFFGVGDTEGLIPNQKTINFLMAMQVLSVQLTGWPKLVYKSGQIDPTKVTNVPGEMIEDKAPPGTKAVEYLTPGAVNGQAQMLVEKFIEFTREMTGANDAATGEAPSAQLNATAIMLLQKASGVPIESIKRRFYQCMEDVGRIWEEFWKVKYNLPRNVMLKDDEGNEYPTVFDGEKYKDVELKLKIDIGPSSSYSESLMMSSLDRLFDGQHINLQQYLKYAPKNVVPFRDRLLKEIEEMQAQMPPPPDPMQEAQMQMDMQAQQEDRKFQQTLALKDRDNQTKVEIAQINAQARQPVATGRG